MSKKKQGVEKKPAKTKLPENDAQVELTEDELNKVSGGFTYQKIIVNTKLGVRDLGIRDIGLRDGGLTGFKVEIDG